VRLGRERPIAREEDAPALLTALADLGAQALLEALALLALGRLPSVPQDDDAATLAPRLSREDGRIRWTEPARRVVDRHRGVAGWPGSWCAWADAVLKVHVLTEVAGSGEPGTVLSVDAEGVVVACGDGAVRLAEVQAAGKPRLAARAWANGARATEGVRLA
jgi:methionyl-tRNA formyltransferase